MLRHLNLKINSGSSKLFSGIDTKHGLPMTLILDLPPQIEAILQQQAASMGQDINSLALAMLAYGLSADNCDFLEAVQGIQKGLDDFDGGRFFSLEDFVAEQNKKYGLSLEA